MIPRGRETFLPHLLRGLLNASASRNMPTVFLSPITCRADTDLESLSGPAAVQSIEALRRRGVATRVPARLNRAGPRPANR